MVYIGGDQVLLFGGYSASGISGEAWLATGFYSGTWYRVYMAVVAE